MAHTFKMLSYCFYMTLCLSTVIGCASTKQKRMPETTSDNGLNQIPNSLEGEAADLPPVDPFALEVKDLKVTAVMSEGVSYPLVQFVRDDFADYTEYEICDLKRSCTISQTPSSQIFWNQKISGIVIVRLRSCVKVKRSTRHTENCGYWVSQAIDLSGEDRGK